MSLRTEWEVLVSATISEIAAGATTISLYGTDHPRAAQGLRRLLDNLERLLAGEPELALVLLGEELFVQGRPFTRTARQAPAVIRRFRRRGIGHVTFRRGVTDAELQPFLVELAATDESAMTSRAHIAVGTVELSERDLGGPDSEEGRKSRRKLPTVRDRVELVHDTLEGFSLGRGLQVGDLEGVARSLLDALARDPDPIHHLAPWLGEERWLAVHSHNVCALVTGLARMTGTAAPACVELGIGALVHDAAKVFFPLEVRSRELDFTGSELELLLDHPRSGLEMLLATGQLPPIALIVVYEHHLSYNGTGYPRLPRPRRPHPASRLVSVCDAFDILRTARGGRGLATREATRAWISERAGTHLDPGWAGALLELDEHSTAEPPR